MEEDINYTARPFNVRAASGSANGGVVQHITALLVPPRQTITPVFSSSTGPRRLSGHLAARQGAEDNLTGPRGDSSPPPSRDTPSATRSNEAPPPLPPEAPQEGATFSAAGSHSQVASSRRLKGKRRKPSGVC